MIRRLLGRGGPPVPPPDPKDGLALFDERTPLPPGAEERLRGDHPRLLELRAAYEAVDLPVRVPSRWSAERVDAFLDLRWFRGETLITWHYREDPRIDELKYFVMLSYVAARDPRGLLRTLEEDGAFGCWTFDYAGWPKVSRDLIESVNEIGFLERELGLSERSAIRVLDVGAGYGRLAHRLCGAYPQVSDYCCVDAIAESTFLAEYYLEHRGVTPPARVVPLHEMETTLEPGGFDLAVNVHSFSECTLPAIEWWVQYLARLEVPELVIVPNDGERLLSMEADGSRQDFAPLLAAVGYEQVTVEPVWDDPAVRQLIGLDDYVHRFTLRR